MALIKATGVKLTPAFDVYLNANQTGITYQAQNLVKFNGEYFDTHNAFDTTDGQNKFTVPSGKEGKYFFYAGIDANPNANNQTQEANLSIYKNGSLYRRTRFMSHTTYKGRYAPITISTSINLVANDYIQIYFYGYDSNSSHSLIANHTFFGGYRIGD